MSMQCRFKIIDTCFWSIYSITLV